MNKPAVVLTLDRTRAQPGEPKARAVRLRRFLRWLFLLLP